MKRRVKKTTTRAAPSDTEGVDQVIGARQKSKGMSWSPTGSKALEILKVVELNGQRDQLWFPEKAAS